MSLLMDFDSKCSLLQGCLRSLQKSIDVPFASITKESPDGAEKVAEEVFLILRDCSMDDIRKCHFLMVLNTDFSFIDLIEGDRNYIHLLETLPRLSPFLYWKILLSFNDFTCLGEVILFSPEVIAVDVLKCVCTNLKSARKDALIVLLRTLLSSLYHKVILLNTSNCLYRKQKFVKIFKQFLDFSISGYIRELDLKPDHAFHYFGHTVKMYLNVLELCINLYKSGSCVNPLEMYLVNIDFNYSTWHSAKFEMNWPNHCLGVLISKCLELVKGVSIDMYISWCEVDIDEKEERTLQTVVRESAYTCKEAIRSLVATDEVQDVVQLEVALMNISLKPKSESEEVSEADLATLLVNIKNPQRNRALWLKGLVNHAQFLSDKVHITTLVENTHSLDVKSLILIMEKVVHLLKSSDLMTDMGEEYKEMIGHCVQSLSLENQISLLDIFLKTFGIMDLFKTTCFQSKMTQIFNQIVDGADLKEKVYPEIIWLAFQSGEELLSKCLEVGMCGGPKNTLIVKILGFLRPLCSFPSKPQKNVTTLLKLLLEALTKRTSESPQQLHAMVHMTLELTKSDLVNGEALMSAFFLPGLEKSLASSNWSLYMCFLDFFQPIVEDPRRCGIQIKSVLLLAFLCQGLNQCRPKPKSFSAISASVCEKNVYLVHRLSSQIVGSKTEEDKDLLWLRGLISQFSPLTWYHARAIWTTWEVPTPPDPSNLLSWTKSLLGHESLPLNGDEKQRYVLQLCKVLPLLTPSEFKTIGGKRCPLKSPKEVFDILVNCLLVLRELSSMRENLECLSHTLNNLLLFVKVRLMVQIKKQKGSGWDDELYLKLSHLKKVFEGVVSPLVSANIDCTLLQLKGLQNTSQN